MTDHNSPRPELRAGLILAGLHYKIVPIGQGQKYPPIQKWQEAATDDLNQVAAWLAETNYGIGWAMGEQPNGKHLFCLDIDGEEGVQSLRQLLRQHGDSETFDLTCQQLTGSGGFHYVFEAPYEIRNSAKQFAPSVDIRGEGGQIVCGPTIHPNGTAYRWLKGPKKNPPQLAPQWVLDRIAEIAEPAIQPSAPQPLISTDQIKPHVPHRGTDGESPMEWLNRTFDGFDALMRLGWKEASRRGEESQMVRPGKEVREGTGGTYHHDTRVFNVYSTGIAPEYGWVGKSNRDGSLMLLPADLWMVENGFRNVSEASSIVRITMMPRSVPAVVVATQHHDGDYGSENPPLNLPDEFWNARPEFAHIRQAGYSRMVSPDSVLGAVITRYATAIPPNYQIDDMIGTWGTFDHLAVLVSPTAIGKSSSMSLAERLWEGPQYKTIVWRLPKPSGEGLVDAFFEEVTEDEGGKKVRVKKKTKTAVMFSVGEAMSLIKSGMRQGATIADVLISAWSGEDPGTANASADRKRVGMYPGTFRMSGLMAMQTELGHHFFTQELMEQGLSSRLLMHSAIDPNMPDEENMPEWPGALDLPVLDTVPTVVEYPKEVVSYIRQFHHNKATGKAVVDPSEGHTNLVRLKLTGIFGFWAGRTNPNLEDWELAGMVVGTHKKIKDRILAHKSEADRRANVTKATASAHFDITKEEVTERRSVANAKQQILRHLDAHGEVKRRHLKDNLMHGSAKKFLTPALHSLVEDGLIVWQDGTIKKT